MLNTKSDQQSFEVTVVSVTLSLILARVIYLIFDWLSELVEEVVDPEIRGNYRKSKYYLLNAVVGSLCLIFIFALIHRYYSHRLKLQAMKM